MSCPDCLRELPPSPIYPDLVVAHARADGKLCLLGQINLNISKRVQDYILDTDNKWDLDR